MMVTTTLFFAMISYHIDIVERLFCMNYGYVTLLPQSLLCSTDWYPSPLGGLASPAMSFIWGKLVFVGVYLRKLPTFS
jgi:hypothetical protein